MFDLFKFKFSFFGGPGDAKCHVPDCTRQKSFTDLLVVCSYGVLVNVLSHNTYLAPGMNRSGEMDNAQVLLWSQYDVNGLSEDDRKLFCLARGRSIELIAWLSMTYTTGISNMPIQELFVIALVDICKLLCDYKWQLDRKNVDCSPDFTLGRLKIQIRAALALVIDKLDIPPVTLEKLAWDPTKWTFPMPENFSRNILPHVDGMKIQRSSAPSYRRKTQKELFKMGETTLDLKFARRLEVKREIIGMFCNNITVMFNPHVRTTRRRHFDG